jgi:hypothetical protein
VHPALRVTLWHFLVKDSTSRGHPLHIAGSETTPIAEAVAVGYRPGEHVRDSLDASVRMPGESGKVILRTIVAEIVEEEEWIEFSGFAEAERALELDARALDGRFRMDDSFDWPDGHGCSSRR